ncbi:MAG: SPFH domain-containing protein [Oscillospiraceae bacterium]|nr:SPFH domain-containing protein [Oscillospiraceae bacterium]
MSDVFKTEYVEKEPKTSNGMAALVATILTMLVSILFVIIGGIWMAAGGGRQPFGVILLIIGILYICTGWIFFLGLKVIKPNEAIVLTLFGKYYGTIKREGFYYVNPFVSAVNPAANYKSTTSGAMEKSGKSSLGSIINTAVTLDATGSQEISLGGFNKKISLKVSTINNETQKINDQMGNPIIIGIVVIWRVINPTKAVFNTDNYIEYLSIQCDSALRNIVRLYPYDTFGDDNEKTLRASSLEIALKLKDEIQEKMDIAGIEIIEARITQLSYAPEIAAAMLQRQQASAVVDARQMIVEGAVGMVELALAKLSENDIVKLDDERKAAMVSNLMVVLCGSRDAQPVINSGTIY